MTFTVFERDRLIAAGDAALVREAVTAAQARGADRVLVFDDLTGAQVDLGPATEYSATPAKPVRGRPRLGVVAREVTLLPRHWDWLAEQPGGASAALRRLVEEARRTHEPAARARAAQTAVYRAMQALAGDLPAYEDALRALYAQDDARFDGLVESWPPDVRDYVLRLAAIERTARP